MNYKEVPDAIHDLVETVNNMIFNVKFDAVETHPITIATYFHNRFLGEIHPFADGNGRICRIITNDILLKSGFPPIFIKDTNKFEYFKLFEKSSSVELFPMLDFFANQLVESLLSKKAFLLKNEYDNEDNWN